jgi:hypothetical protein
MPNIRDKGRCDHLAESPIRTAPLRPAGRSALCCPQRFPVPGLRLSVPGLRISVPGLHVPAGREILLTGVNIDSAEFALGVRKRISPGNDRNLCMKSNTALTLILGFISRLRSLSRVYNS